MLLSLFFILLFPNLLGMLLFCNIFCVFALCVFYFPAACGLFGGEKKKFIDLTRFSLFACHICIIPGQVSLDSFSVAFG